MAASCSSHARGVLTVVHNPIPLNIIRITTGPRGKYSIIHAPFYKLLEYCQQIYGPNKDIFQN